MVLHIYTTFTGFLFHCTSTFKPSVTTAGSGRERATAGSGRERATAGSGCERTAADSGCETDYISNSATDAPATDAIATDAIATGYGVNDAYLCQIC